MRRPWNDIIVRESSDGYSGSQNYSTRYHICRFVLYVILYTYTTRRNYIAPLTFYDLGTNEFV